MMNDLFQEDIIPRRTLGEVLESNIVDRPIIQGGEVSGSTTIDGRRASVVATAINDLGQATSIMDFSVTEAKLANLAVATRAIQDDAITAAKVWKGGSVITLSAQIGTGVIGSAHIGTGVIGSAHIGTGVIGSAHIGSAQIGSAHIASLAVGDAHISNLNADKITAGTITGRTVRTGAVGQHRIEITRTDDWDPNRIRFITSGGGVWGEILLTSWFAGDALAVRGHEVRIETIGWTGGLRVMAGGTICESLSPWTHDANDIGWTTNRFRDLYLSQDCHVGRQIYLTPRTDAFATRGSIMFLSTNNRLMCHDGTAWRTISWT